MTALRSSRRRTILARFIRMISPLMALSLLAPGVARAESGPDPLASALTGGVGALAGASIVLAIMGMVTWAILTTRRLKGSSLFNRLFVIVAVTSGFFSAVSSAIGFSLITSQETIDFFRNFVLPPAFGVFVFFLAVAIWVGGAELVRHRDWFRKVGRGFVADILFFFERALKIFFVIPILATILFFVSTWTTVVGIGGVDAVRHTYNSELQRLQAECSGITGYRQRDFLFLEDLRLAIGDAVRASEAEKSTGAQTGAAGRGAVSDYYQGVATWLKQLKESVANLIKQERESGASPYDSDICSATIEKLKNHLSSNAYENYDAWAREFETQFDDFVAVLNRWRHDRRIERLLEQQLASFDRANPRPSRENGRRLSQRKVEAIDTYTQSVESALETLLRKQKLAKPPVPLESAAERSPERGIEIFKAWFRPQEAGAEGEEERVPRTAAVVAGEFVPGLSTITPRDAVLKNASIFSDIWALAIAWDYAAYVLMLAFLFFPSAERAAGFKD